VSGGRRFPQVGSCRLWVIAVRGWVGSSLSMSGGVIVHERAVAIVHAQGVVAVLLVQVVVDRGGLEPPFVGGCRPSTGWGSSSSRGGGRRPRVGGGVPTVCVCSSSVGGCRS
jgi:hypothetical protein